VLVCALALPWAPGCGRSRAQVEGGEIVSHPLGFSITVPEGWMATVNDEGVKLVRQETHGHGYPTLRIDAIGASALPADFPAGRGFRWSGGKGGYDYGRWTNGLGYGSELTVHLDGEGLYLVAQAQLWERKVRIDRGFYKREIWPVINSIQQP
jgi:hypothetical protein